MAKRSGNDAAKSGNGSGKGPAPLPLWPADQVERRPVADLVPYARNARTHSDDQVEQIAASIREFGWTTPLLVDENGSIVAGHGRVLAAQKLGIREIPVMVAVGWSDEQKRAYVLADNKLALNAGWDEQLLREELTELADLGFDISTIGFSQAEIDEMFGSVEPPADFKDLDPESLPTEHQCPKCGYTWSGKSS